MEKEELLLKLREERPKQVIHEVISFKTTNYNFLNVLVDMEYELMDSTVKHVKMHLPYPKSEYEKLSEEEKLNFIWQK